MQNYYKRILLAMAASTLAISLAGWPALADARQQAAPAPSNAESAQSMTDTNQSPAAIDASIGSGEPAAVDGAEVAGVELALADDSAPLVETSSVQVTADGMIVFISTAAGD